MDQVEIQRKRAEELVAYRTNWLTKHLKVCQGVEVEGEEEIEAGEDAEEEGDIAEMTSIPRFI